MFVMSFDMRDLKFWMNYLSTRWAAPCLGALTLSAQAQDGFPQPKDVPLNWSECKMPSCMVVSVPDVARMVGLYNQARDRIADLERQLRELQAAKGCAKLEVTEPPKDFVPHKERDS